MESKISEVFFSLTSLVSTQS